MKIAEKTLLSEVIIIAKLMIVMPATNAVSERSFSTLKRTKTYLRSTMLQERLNQKCAVAHPQRQSGQYRYNKNNK